MKCETCGHSECQCRIFVPSEDLPVEPAPSDVLPLSDYEKEVILCFRREAKNWLPPSADANDLNKLYDHEEAYIIEYRIQQGFYNTPAEQSADSQDYIVTEG